MHCTVEYVVRGGRAGYAITMLAIAAFAYLVYKAAVADDALEFLRYAFAAWLVSKTSPFERVLVCSERRERKRKSEETL